MRLFLVSFVRRIKSMKRYDILKRVGAKYFTSNLENGEWSYPKAFRDAGKCFEPILNAKGKEYRYVDMRFENDIIVLVETKQDYSKNLRAAIEQLAAYVYYEQQLSTKKVVAILANTTNNNFMLFVDQVDSNHYFPEEWDIDSIKNYEMRFM